MKTKISKPVIYRLLIVIYIIAMTAYPNPFSFMSLNVFLAWLPIEFGLLFTRIQTNWRYLFGGLWLLFFPNVPYLLTDLFHLEALSIYQSQGLFQLVPTDWLLFLLLVLPIFIMVLVGMNQAVGIVRQLPYGKNYSGFSLTLLAFLSGVAIYIGRFERIHSIELILHPVSTLSLLIGDWSVGKLQFVLVFMVIQWGIWLLLKELNIIKIED